MFDKSSQIKYGALISYLSLFINILIGLVYTPWMVNTIGKGNYGLYALAMSIISIFVFDFGLSSAITRFISKYLAENKKEKINQLLGIVYKLYILADVIILFCLVVIYFLIPYIYDGLSPDEIDKFKVVYVIAASFCVVSFPYIPLNGILTAYEKFIQLKLCDIAQRLLIVVLMSACLFMGAGLYALVIVNAISGVVAIFLKLQVIHNSKVVHIDWNFWNNLELKHILNFSVWVTIMALAQRMIFNIAPSVLGITSDSHMITIFSIAMTLEGFLFTFANAINGMFLPKVSRIVNDKTEILDLMIRIGRLQIYIVGFLLLAFICVGKDFIAAWMGTGFDDVYLCALLLMIPSFFHLPQEIGSTTVIASNHVKSMAIVFVLMAVVNISLMFPFSVYAGVLGLSFSIFISYLIRTIGMDWIFYKKLSINIWEFCKQSYLKIIPTYAISLLISFGICMNINLQSWVGVIAKGFLVTLVYFLCIWLGAMNTSEKKLVKSIFIINSNKN